MRRIAAICVCTMFVAAGRGEPIRLLSDLVPDVSTRSYTPPGTFQPFDGKVLFELPQFYPNLNPWISNGSRDGTFPLLESPLYIGSTANLGIMAGSIYAAEVEEGATFPRSSRIWKLDGTPGGGEVVKEFPQVIEFGESAATGDMIVYMMDAGRGWELGVTDGTEAKKRLIEDAARGAENFNPELAFRRGRFVFFRANPRSTGEEPYILDLAQLPEFAGENFVTGWMVE